MQDHETGMGLEEEPRPGSVEDEPERVEEEAANGSGEPESVMDRLRERREELRSERSKDIDIPGYNGELVARYRPVPWDDLRKIANKVEKSKNPRRELYAQVDTLIRACDSIWLRVEIDGGPELQPLPGGEEDPIRYDNRLAELFKIEGEQLTARKVLLALFNNDLAVTTHHNEVALWMQNADEEADEELLGESRASDRY